MENKKGRARAKKWKISDEVIERIKERRKKRLKNHSQEGRNSEDNP